MLSSMTTLKFEIPKGLPALIHKLSKAIIKEQPENLYQFSAKFLENELRLRSQDEEPIEELISADNDKSRDETSGKYVTKEADSGRAEEGLAATKIQAGFRGYKARKDMKLVNRRSTEDVPKKIQSPPPLATIKEEEEAATKIQAGIRGFLTRKKMKQSLDFGLEAEEAGPVDHAQPEEVPSSATTDADLPVPEISDATTLLIVNDTEIIPDAVMGRRNSEGILLDSKLEKSPEQETRPKSASSQADDLKFLDSGSDVEEPKTIDESDIEPDQGNANSSDSQAILTLLSGSRAENEPLVQKAEHVPAESSQIADDSLQVLKEVPVVLKSVSFEMEQSTEPEPEAFNAANAEIASNQSESTHLAIDDDVSMSATDDAVHPETCEIIPESEKADAAPSLTVPASPESLESTSDATTSDLTEAAPSAHEALSGDELELQEPKALLQENFDAYAEEGVGSISDVMSGGTLASVQEEEVAGSVVTTPEPITAIELDKSLSQEKLEILEASEKAPIVVPDEAMDTPVEMKSSRNDVTVLNTETATTNLAAAGTIAVASDDAPVQRRSSKRKPASGAEKYRSGVVMDDMFIQEPAGNAHEIHKLEEMDAEIESDATALNNAASKIQAGFRGYQVRKTLNNAATKIQSNYRGYTIRKSLRHRANAATKIQATVRGYLTRKRIYKSKAQQLEHRRNASRRRSSSAIHASSNIAATKRYSE